MIKTAAWQGLFMASGLTASLVIHAGIVFGVPAFSSPSGLGERSAESNVLVVKTVQKTSRLMVAEQPEGGEALNPVSASRVLRDPSIGAVFSVYFRSIRAKIEAVSRQEKYRNYNTSIVLRFILNRYGQIVSQKVIEGKGSGNESADAAKRILSNAGPFNPFPKAVDYEKISFIIRLNFG